jgi:hypothetical protein
MTAKKSKLRRREMKQGEGYNREGREEERELEWKEEGLSSNIWSNTVSAKWLF